MVHDSAQQKTRNAPSGWKASENIETGSFQVVSPDMKTYIGINYGDTNSAFLGLLDDITVDITEGESLSVRVFGSEEEEIPPEVEITHIKEGACTVRVFDAELVINQKGEVHIRAKDTTFEVDGDVELRASGCATIAAETIEMEKA
jgi:hypothetical protein